MMPPIDFITITRVKREWPRMDTDKHASKLLFLVCVHPWLIIGDRILTVNARLPIFALVLSVVASAQPPRPIRVKPEKKEPVTQALEALPEPPAAIAAETAKLAFYVSPLSNKGLLSQQIRDGLKAIDR